MGLHLEPWIANVLESESMQECRIVVNGLSFYVPDSSGETAVTAYDRYDTIMHDARLDMIGEWAVGGDFVPLDESSDPRIRALATSDPDLAVVPGQPDCVYALTPAGESLLSDLDTSELEQVERDLKKHRCCPQ